MNGGSPEKTYKMMCVKVKQNPTRMRKMLGSEATEYYFSIVQCYKLSHSIDPLFQFVRVTVHME